MKQSIAIKLSQKRVQNSEQLHTVKSHARYLT